jgi:hypothetical protein
MLSRRYPRWQVESGPDYDLCEYQGGQPTGRVAVMSWPGDFLERVKGHHVWLLGEKSRVTIAERRDPGLLAVRLQVPLRSCVDAKVVGEPGLPRVRLDLTIRMGGGTFTIPLWFSSAERPVLEGFIGRIRRLTDQAEPSPSARFPQPISAEPPRHLRAESATDRPVTVKPRLVPPESPAPRTKPGQQATPPGVTGLPRLDVRMAPDDDDWIVFRPGDCSAEVLKPATDPPPPPRTGVQR